MKKNSLNQSKKENRAKEARFWEIDFLRGTAVIMMVVFHFFWDTNFFGFTNFSLYGGFFGVFQKLTAGLFLLLVGATMAISYARKKENFQTRFLVRFAKISLPAFLITAFSIVFFPLQPIFFGILHLIAFSTLVCVAFVKRKILSLGLGLFFIFSPLFFDFSRLNFESFFWLGLSKGPAALDFFPAIPWIGAVFAGIFFGAIFYENFGQKTLLKKPVLMPVDAVCHLGRHSLFIYFIHQPILFSAVFLAKILLQ